MSPPDASSAPRSGEFASVRILAESSDLTFGEFLGTAQDPIWDIDQSVGDGFHVVFPLTGAVIAQEGRGEATVDTNYVAFYEPGQIYRRRRLAGRDDHCLFVVVDEHLADELSAIQLPRSRFTTRSDARVHAFVISLWRNLADGRPISSLELQESLLSALAAVLDVGPRRPTAGSTARPATEAARRRLVEDVRAILVEDVTAELSLDDIASQAGYSRFHTARVFRRQTGSSIHEYRDLLRLMVGVCELSGRDTSLGDIAAELGYSSHAHFTQRFAAVFGAPPSTWRRALREAQVPQLRALASL